MTRSFVRLSLTLALGLGLASCDTPTMADPVAADPRPGAIAATHLPDAAVVAKASGTAFRFPLLPDGTRTTVRVTFNAIRRADGSADGFFSYHQGGVELEVAVTCMTVVEGNRAWIAGVITESTIGFLGHVSYFYTFDNGNAGEDIISLLRVETQPGLGEAQRFCDELPTVLAPRAVERGNVSVRG
ncbi:MAG TPA: hypothetical protein VK933_15620 [Longimicrobiales bacterium]|nr:hypothetical protein [Longimicrobiales bacterium]